jgi:hypothetical protein
MSTCYDNRFSIQLVCDCKPNPIRSQASHDTSLDNYTTQTLYDVKAVTSIVPVSAPPRILVSAPGTSAAARAGYAHGQLPPNNSATVTFAVSTQGSGPRTETVATTLDWALSADDPVTGTPAQRFSRNCQYSVSVQ